MPRGNGLGPVGLGPMSGRSAGLCAGATTPGFANPDRGRGLGLGVRRGRNGGCGFRNRNYANGYCQDSRMTVEQEKEYLSNKIVALENELKISKNRLDEFLDK